MATAVKKITLSSSRDIPFNKLVLSQSNVRRIKAGVSIEELAEDIGRRTLLQSITVRPVRDADGVETGMFEVPAGGRRFRALERLVKQKRLAKTAPVPCVVREDGIPEEDSLAENVQRAPLHPLDQFRAFLTLREKGQSEEDIAAAFFVAVSVVKQRLRLASVSPKLLDVYADDGMTLDQLMAFTVNGDHERQEQVFERLSQSYSKEPHVIRRMLTEGAVRASDKRAQFIGLDAYTGAGGLILRDLFQGDDGGWLQDVGLLDTLVAEKLRAESEAIRAEGWKWIDIAPDFAYGHTYGLRQLRGEQIPLTDEEQATRDALQAEMDGLEETYAEADELPDEVDQRLVEIETAVAAFDDRPQAFDPDEVARAGAFVSIDGSGVLRVERGYVRPEDELPIAPEADVETDPTDAGAIAVQTEDDDASADAESPADEPEEDDGIKPIPDRLMTELTAHRTLALRHALGEHPDIAFVAALHALCLKLFYRYAQDTCLELDVKSAGFGAQAPGLADSAAADRRTVAPDRVAAPASPYILQAGAVIAAALITGIHSDLPGQITAQVTENIYDSPTGRILLVPQGTRVIGQYNNSVQFGQSRVLLVWNRLIFPNGRSIVLERQPGADVEGYAGLQDGVDYHWWELAKTAGLSTLLSVGAELATNDDDRLIQAIRNGGQDTINDAGQQIIRRQLNVAPTLTIRPGFPVRVIVTRDLVLEPYGG